MNPIREGIILDGPEPSGEGPGRGSRTSHPQSTLMAGVGGNRSVFFQPSTRINHTKKVKLAESVKKMSELNLRKMIRSVTHIQKTYPKNAKKAKEREYGGGKDAFSFQGQGDQHSGGFTFRSVLTSKKMKKWMEEKFLGGYWKKEGEPNGWEIPSW